MIKIIGSILIILGTALVGLKNIVKLKKREKNLRMICTSLEILSSEISEKLSPMPELLDILSDAEIYPVNELFRCVRTKLSELEVRSFYEIWVESVEETGILLLTSGQKQILKELGFSLGRYSVYEQKKAIEYAKRRFETELKRAEKVSEKDSRLHAALGVAAGVFAVIIFI